MDVRPMRLSPFNKFSDDDHLLALEVVRMLFVLQIFFGLFWDLYKLRWLALTFETIR